MPGTNNFLVFNPNDVSNTDDDATYAAETQRLNGIQNGIAKTSMHNKFYRQVSVMVAAFAQYMANQGQNVSDSDLNALITAITNTFSTSIVKKSVSEVLVTGTTQQTIANYTPTIRGNYQVNVYLRVITASTVVTVNITYTDASGNQTNTMLSQTLPVGDYSLIPLMINSSPAAISVKVTAGTANQVYVSSSILGV